MEIALVGHTVPQSGVMGVSKGIRNYIYNLGKSFLKQGHNVELIIRDDFRPKEKWIRTVYAPKFSWVPFPLFLTPKVLQTKADVYHSDYVTTGVPLIVGRKRPCVVAIHDVIPFMTRTENLPPKEKIFIAYYKKCFSIIKNADALIVLTKNAKKEALRYTKLPEEKFHVVYPGVDTQIFKPLQKKGSDKIKIGYIGGLGGRKNVMLLINAFKELVKRFDNIELHISGSGPDVESHIERFRQLKIPHTFYYADMPFEKVNKFNNKLDIFVYSTLGEGFGLPPLEAMASGVPVVSTNVTTMPEVIGDAGILVEPNVKDMVDGISKLVESKLLRKKLRERGLERAREFNWDACARNTLKVYDSIIK